MRRRAMRWMRMLSTTREICCGRARGKSSSGACVCGCLRVCVCVCVCLWVFTCVCLCVCGGGVVTCVARSETVWRWFKWFCVLALALAPIMFAVYSTVLVRARKPGGGGDGHK